MPRKPDPRREEARRLWEESGGTLTNREIADKVNKPERTISCWKSRDGWGKKKDCSTAKERSTAKKRGGQPGNKNAAGHGRPVEHGLAVAEAISDRIKADPSQLNSVMAEMPADIVDIMQRVEGEDPVSLQRQIVNFQFAAIVQSYRYIQMYTEAAEKMYYAANRLRVINAEKAGIDKEEAYAYEKSRVDAVLDCLELAKATLGPDKRAGYVLAVNKAISDFHSSVARYQKAVKGLEDREKETRIAKMQAEVNKLESAVIGKEINIIHSIPGEEAAGGYSD